MSTRIRSAAAATLILAATACLALGLTFPVIRLDYLYFWTDTYSLTGIVRQLFDAGEFFLAAIIFVFSILFPAFKLAYLLIVYMSPGHHHQGLKGRERKRLDWLGKWSMLDVLVLALIVFYAKTMHLTNATTLSGIYLFAASVILTMIAYGLLEADAADSHEEHVSGETINGSKTRRLDSAPS
ncbi:MAG: paraquat-inducible protein A [Chitinophagales bacterium]|nr:paraquat-inducible protein A [Hyphomicrobiales bacterium]